jgi:hypothetical protein
MPVNTVMPVGATGRIIRGTGVSADGIRFANAAPIGALRAEAEDIGCSFYLRLSGMGDVKFSCTILKRIFMQNR